MVSSLTRNQVRRKPLRVRLPCPPLLKPYATRSYARLSSCVAYTQQVGYSVGAMPVLCSQNFFAAGQELA